LDVSGLGPAPVEAVLFDKDGTLFSFQATWGAWTADLIEELAPGAPLRQAALAEALSFDLDARIFHPDSPVIAGTLDDALDLLAPCLPDLGRQSLKEHLILRSAELVPVEAVPLGPLAAHLSEAGLRLGVATNDSEVPTRAQLAALGLEEAFDFIAGADSGHGFKPGPGPCLAFLDAIGVAPGAAVMVGDSRHDLDAGRAAGMRCVAVLTGVADAATLAPHADAVLPDIGHLPRWLGLHGTHRGDP
jgi:phosphoglycolate phosphatase